MMAGHTVMGKSRMRVLRALGLAMALLMAFLAMPASALEIIDSSGGQIYVEIGKGRLLRLDEAPATVYAKLLDDGVYLASVPTMYRILRAEVEALVEERGVDLRRRPVHEAGLVEHLRDPVLLLGGVHVPQVKETAGVARRSPLTIRRECQCPGICRWLFQVSD